MTLTEEQERETGHGAQQTQKDWQCSDYLQRMLSHLAEDLTQLLTDLDHVPVQDEPKAALPQSNQDITSTVIQNSNAPPVNEERNPLFSGDIQHHCQETKPLFKFPIDVDESLNLDFTGRHSLTDNETLNLSFTTETSLDSESVVNHATSSAGSQASSQSGVLSKYGHVTSEADVTSVWDDAHRLVDNWTEINCSDHAVNGLCPPHLQQRQHADFIAVSDSELSALDSSYVEDGSVYSSDFIPADLDIFRTFPPANVKMPIAVYKAQTCNAPVVDTEHEVSESPKPRSLSMLERVTMTHPIWFLPDVGRTGAIHLLKDSSPGAFIVRRSSHKNTWALSLQFSQGYNLSVDHYLIMSSQGGLHIHGSYHCFAAIPNLVAHYCQHRDEMPQKLALPDVIQNAKSPQELQSLALLGQDFWTSSLSRNKGKKDKLKVKEKSLHKSSSEPISINQSFEAASVSGHDLPLSYSSDNFISYPEQIRGDLCNNNDPHVVNLHRLQDTQLISDSVFTPISKPENELATNSLADADGGILDSSFESISFRDDKPSDSTQLKRAALYGTTSLDFFAPPHPRYYAGNLSDRLSDYDDVWNKPTPSPKQSSYHNDGCGNSVVSKAVSDTEKSLTSTAKREPCRSIYDFAKFDFTNINADYYPLTQDIPVDNHKATSVTKEVHIQSTTTNNNNNKNNIRTVQSVAVQTVNGFKHSSVKAKSKAPPPLPPLVRVKSSSIPSLLLSKSPGYVEPYDTLDSQSISSLSDYCTKDIHSSQERIHRGLRRRKSLPSRSQRTKERKAAALLRSSRSPDPVLSPIVCSAMAVPSTTAGVSVDVANARSAKPPLARSPRSPGIQREVTHMTTTTTVFYPQHQGYPSVPMFYSGAPPQRAPWPNNVFFPGPLIPFPATRPDMDEALETTQHVTSRSSTQVLDKNARDALFMMEDLERADQDGPVSPSLNKFPVCNGDLICDSNRSSFSESSTVDDLISSALPDVSVKPLTLQTSAQPKRVADYDNLIGQRQRNEGSVLLRGPSVQTMTSIGTVFSKPWDSSVWTNVLGQGAATQADCQSLGYASTTDDRASMDGRMRIRGASTSSVASQLRHKNRNSSASSTGRDRVTSFASTNSGQFQMDAVAHPPGDNNGTVFEEMPDNSHIATDSEHLTQHSITVVSRVGEPDDQHVIEQRVSSESHPGISMKVRGHLSDNHVPIERLIDIDDNYHYHELSNISSDNAKITEPNVSLSKQNSERVVCIESKPPEVPSKRGNSLDRLVSHKNSTTTNSNTVMGEFPISTDSEQIFVKQYSWSDDLAVPGLSIDDNEESDDELILGVQKIGPIRSPSQSNHLSPTGEHGRARSKSRQAGYRVREYICSLACDKQTIFGSTIENFTKCTVDGHESNSHVVMRNVRQFMNGMKNYLIKQGQLEDLIEKERIKLDSDEILNIDSLSEGALHKCVIKPLKRHIYTLLVNESKNNGSLHQLADNIKFAQSRTAVDIGVKAGMSLPDQSTMEQIHGYLQCMQKAYSPVKKLQNLLAAIRAIYNCVHTQQLSSAKLTKQTSIGADDFLPLFIYVLVQCGFIAAEIEAEYMWGLLHPSLLSGEGGYYLTSLSSAVVVIHNLREAFENEVNVDANDDLNRQRKPSIHEFHACLKIAIPDERHDSIVWKTLPVRPNMLAKDVCTMLAHKLKVTTGQEYSLYSVQNDHEQLLADSECPQNVKADALERGRHCVFVYKRKGVTIALPKALKDKTEQESFDEAF